MELYTMTCSYCLSTYHIVFQSTQRFYDKMYLYLFQHYEKQMSHSYNSNMRPVFYMQTLDLFSHFTVALIQFMPFL